SHYGVSGAAEFDGLACNPGVAGELALPEAVAQYHRGNAGFIFRRDQQPPDCRLHPQHLEVVRGDRLSPNGPRVSVTLDGQAGAADANESVERLVLAAEVLVEGIRIGTAQPVQLIRFLHAG